MYYLKSICSTIILVIACLLTFEERVFSDDNGMIAYENSDLSFAFYTREGLVCYPEFLVDKWSFFETIPDSIDSIIGEAEANLETVLIPFADDILKDYISNRPGDTVSVLWSGGISRAVIEEVGGYCEACRVDIVCVLKTIDPLPDYPAYDHSFVVLRQKIADIQNPIKFDEIGYLQPSLDSLTEILTAYAHKNPNKFRYLWLNMELNGARDDIEKKRITDRYEKYWDKIPYFPEKPILKIYGTESKSLSDSVWCLVTELRDYGMVFLFKTIITGDSMEMPDSIYVTHKVMNANVFPDFMVDLDSDGTIEILLNKGVCEEIIKITNGSYIKLVESEVRACP